MVRGFTRRFRPLEILTEEEIEGIHRAALDVLRETGVTFENERALNLFEQNDCIVDYEEKRVRLPPGLVEECIRQAPSTYRLRARDPKNDLSIGMDRIYFGLAPGQNTVDLDTWEGRVATKQEYRDFVTVLDYLDTMGWLICYPYFGWEGVDPVMAMVEITAGMIRDSTKVVEIGYQLDSEVFCIEMAHAVGIEILCPIAASPPLTYYSDACEMAFRSVEAGFPIDLCSGGVHGGTAPATIAGAIVSDTVEKLAGLALVQLIRPGTPVVAMDQTTPQNMQTGSPFFGAIGCSLHMVAETQLWRRYGIPHRNSQAGYTNSKRIDFQNGYERAICAQNTALCGASMLSLIGGVYGEVTAHPVQAILDHDIAGMIGRFLEGVTVNDETLAVDVINEVGPIPGFYLGQAHTRKWWKQEQFVPEVSDTLTYAEWMESGRKSCLDYAQEKLERILDTHRPTPLTPGQEEDIQRIVEEARQHYTKKGLME
ncbi:MAG: trimethylamine methyltransferase family protein [Ardenticatenia bacterium]|nr:trimethylamine methyltransferase family protein [Ardenticatenia bacterium]